MTTQEFSDEMDVLLNSYAEAGNSIVLDEYEKSVYLTLAQNQIVKGLYNGTYNGDSFEKTEELRRALNPLVKTYIYPKTAEDKELLKNSPKRVSVSLPKDLWYIIYESASFSDGAFCDKGAEIEVVPVRHDEWHRIRKNPFRGPNKRRVVRLDISRNIMAAQGVELISSEPLNGYTIRYLKEPRPIILVPLEERQAIDGETKITECELGTALHRPILERAVQLASTRIARASNQ